MHNVQEQTAAYEELQRMTSREGVPANVFKKIKQRASGKWPANYEMQLCTVQQELRSYRQLTD